MEKEKKDVTGAMYIKDERGVIIKKKRYMGGGSVTLKNC